jgi:hypothetical protein
MFSYLILCRNASLNYHLASYNSKLIFCRNRRRFCRRTCFVRSKGIGCSILTLNPLRYTSTDGTRNTGFHLNKGDTFLANAQLVNYNKEAKQVYITYDLEWVSGTIGKDVKGTLISVTQCGSPIRLSASGPTNTTSGKFYIMENGKILGARG